MKKILVLVTFIILALSLSGCTFGNKWQGVYYPNGCTTCESDYIFSPVFSNYDECQRWAIDIYNERNNPSDQYECGKNCEFKDGLQVCEETR